MFHKLLRMDGSVPTAIVHACAFCSCIIEVPDNHISIADVVILADNADFFYGSIACISEIKDGTVDLADGPE